MAEALMTPKEVCARLSISRTTLWRLAKAREISSIKIGRQVRFERSSVEAFIKKRTLPAK
jgi:excisionase family DNA binding protein